MSGDKEGPKLAIVGSVRFHTDEEATERATALVRDRIIALSPSLIISGGALGADTIASTLAEELEIPLREFLPVFQRWEPEGYKARNLLIAHECTHLLCVRHRFSHTYGSGWTADRAEEAGAQVERITIST